jgi:hypothetical protein
VSIKGVASSFVLAGGLCCFQQIASANRVEQYKNDGWHVSARHDAFAGTTRCAIRSINHHIIYQPGALGFRFRRHRDTLGAWYHIDGGAPLRWEDRYPALIASGVQIDGPGLDNPTGGIVWLPFADLKDAAIVTIRAGGYGKGRDFMLRGFPQALDAARRLGCATDTTHAS